MHDFWDDGVFFGEKTLDFGVKRGILEEKMHDFRDNGVYSKRKWVIWGLNGGFSKRRCWIFGKKWDFQTDNV